MIIELVEQGKVYAGWSAGAIVASPTLKYFDTMENISKVPEISWEGLNLTSLVVVPHLDNNHFAEAAKQTNQELIQVGYTTVPLNDNQALVINGEEYKVI